jgi:hypothetical protein
MRIQNLILPLLGLLFAGLGLAIWWYFIPLFNQEAARIEPLTPLTASTLAESPLGQEALIEGRVSERNPTQFRLFVAYVRYEYRGDNDEGKSKWVEDERITPPLWLDLPGGRVQLANDNYPLHGQKVIWQSEPTLHWNISNSEGTKSYEGFERSNPILAGGVVVEGVEGRQFKAAWLYGGTRAGYIEDQYSSVTVVWWVGLAFIGVGAILLAIAAWLFFR